ncbi:MAG: hypothetical protein K6T55_01520 [Syntrophobacterales bacterium]|nr:hypothetical protein [Syntrophobacterales bacterium]
MRPEEFRHLSVSLPGVDQDEVPEVCCTCPYLASKWFSSGSEDQVYLFCAYAWPDRLTDTPPPCLAPPAP